MLRKTGIALALSAGMIVATGTSAYALDCSNVSRAAPADPGTPVVSFSDSGPTVWVIQGDWWYINFTGTSFDGSVWDKIPPGTAASVLNLTLAEATAAGLPAGTVNGNYQDGKGIGLLDIAQAPCNANRQTQNGIQASSSRCPTGP